VPSVQSEIADLRERVARLERLRTKRGHCNKKEAAEYIGVSRETLRQLELRGEGPVMNPDGSYNYDQLDLFKETPTAA
jgi:DNA-binding XRE family transcriptional regulator